MRGAVFAAALFAVAAGAALAAPPQPIGPPAVLDENLAASVLVKPAAAAARPTTVSLSLSNYPLTCGRPSFGTIAVSFPAGEHVPARIPVAAVRIANAHVRSVSVAGRTVSIAVSPTAPGGVICQSITMGRLTLTLLPAARLGNPNSAGTYTVTAKHGTATYTAQFSVSS